MCLGGIVKTGEACLKVGLCCQSQTDAISLYYRKDNAYHRNNRREKVHNDGDDDVDDVDDDDDGGEKCGLLSQFDCVDNQENNQNNGHWCHCLSNGSTSHTA